MARLIVVTHDGNTSTVDAIGFSGSGCEAATRAIQEALGVEVDGQHKPEWETEEHIQVNE